MKTTHRQYGDATRTTVKFKTSEYVTIDDFGDGDLAISWTSTMAYAESLALALRYLKNDGSFEVYVSACDVNLESPIAPEVAESILAGNSTVEFIRVDSRDQSLTFGPAVDQVAFELREVGLIVGDLDHRQIAEMMQQSASLMVRANCEAILRTLGIASLSED